MSNTTTETRTVEPLTWKQAADDVHVATRVGEFAGFVEIHARGFVVRDNHGTDLGVFPTLSDARRALETPSHASKGTRGTPAYARRRIRRALA